MQKEQRSGARKKQAVEMTMTVTWLQQLAWKHFRENKYQLWWIILHWESSWGDGMFR